MGTCWLSVGDENTGCNSNSGGKCGIGLELASFITGVEQDTDITP